MTKDHSHRPGLEAEAMFAPAGAPDWATNRGDLWNAAEAKESRKNSILAREMTIAYPHEFTPEQRQAAGMRIAQIPVNRFGAAVDMTWHVPDEGKNQLNFHSHMMFTTRGFEGDDWRKNKYRELNHRKGQESPALLEMREEIAGILNEVSAAHGHDVYVEHLSFKQRGLEKAPTVHEGVKARQLKAAGIEVDVVADNEEIRENNAQRARLQAESNIIDLALERELRRETGKDLTPVDRREILSTPEQRRNEFYARVQNDRTALLAKQDMRFGERESELRKELAALTHSTERTGFLGVVRLWNTVTGRRSEELLKMAELRAEYDRITAEKAAEAAQFEQNRLAQLEALKASEAARERQRLEPQQAQRRHSEESENVHHSAREAAEEAVAAAAAKRREEFKSQAQPSPERPAPDLGKQSAPERGQDDGFEMGR